MNADLLLAHYEQIADAPDAIARLRRFILDLAVRGKLVPQDPNDEPASELLKRIVAEKASLVKAGEIKREKPFEGCSIGELGIALPSGWSIARLSEIAVCLDYRRVPINGTEREARIEGKAQERLFPYYGATQQQGWIDDYLFEGEFVLLGEDGVPFHDPLRAKAYLISGKSWVNNHAHVFQGILTSPRFLVHYLNVFDYDGRVVGATRAKLNQAQAVTIPIPLPPLVEQHRIVAKVDELMGLCDRLEAAQREREASRDRLAVASLARLNAPAPETFEEDARFALDALPALTTRPDQVKALRQTILNLAVRGKLVPQDPKDEPASDVDLKIKNRSRGQIQESIEPPFDLPGGWAWRAIDTLADQVTDGEHATPPRISETQIPLVTAKNVRQGFMDYSQTDWVSFETAQKAWGRCRPQVGDLLLVCVGATTGRLTVLREPRDMVLVRSVALIRPNSNVLNEYLERAIRSPLVQQQIWASVKAAAQPCLYINRIQSLLIPLPPLAEQQRIVAKVDELMALCDQLEASLMNATSTRSRLLNALLAEALMPVETRETEAVE